MSTILNTQRLTLRHWKDEDREPFSRINADSIVMEYMPRVLPPADSDKLIDRFEKHFKKHGYGMFAVERKDDNVFVGTVGLNHVEFKARFTPAIEVAWRLDSDFWGQGYATEAARAVLDYAFNTLGIEEIVSFTVHDNTRSIHVMEKLGFVRDEKGDFDYPTLPKGHPLGRFSLFRLSAKSYQPE